MKKLDEIQIIEEQIKNIEKHKSKVDIIKLVIFLNWMITVTLSTVFILSSKYCIAAQILISAIGYLAAIISTFKYFRSLQSLNSIKIDKIKELISMIGGQECRFSTYISNL